MPVNTTTPSQPSATSATPASPAPAYNVDQARAAWVTAPRDTELDRWGELYALAVPRHDPEAGQ